MLAQVLVRATTRASAARPLEKSAASAVTSYCSSLLLDRAASGMARPRSMRYYRKRPFVGTAAPSVLLRRPPFALAPASTIDGVCDRNASGLSSPLIRRRFLTEAKPDTPEDRPFNKVLVANRGEIALRVLRTCKSLGIPTVTVHSTADAGALHAILADETYCIGPPASLESYLNVDAVCDAIRASGAEAVHPGYGFLSENADFARRITDMGVAFVGPGSDAIVAMGDKIQSKLIAKKAGVNTIPGYDGMVTSPDHAVQVAADIGYPVMIKATSGGGGKGMRICRTEKELIEGYHLSTAEARSFFKDERVFVEKYVERPHHIEFQVLAGRKRNNEDGTQGELEVLCFPERECSIQRRNQKIIEESPSTLLTPETRAEMVRQVKSLVRTVNYESAGTVEFLVDEEQNFYFLEMNTRLQVEHPITECITGVDLVKGMLDVAAGRGIPPQYTALVPDPTDEGAVVPFKGHAIEARIYAEDPLRGFLPSIGPLLRYVEPPPLINVTSPAGGTGDVEIRVDSGVTAGTPITQYYDPMISKLVAYSPRSREEAVEGLAGALDRYVIGGVGHNAAFARDVVRNDDFRAGHTPTNFIPKHYPEGFGGVQLTADERVELAAIAALLSEKKGELLRLPPLPLSEEGGGMVVCLGGMFGEAFLVTTGDDIGKGALVKPLSTEMSGNQREVHVTDLQYDPSKPIAEVEIGGEMRALQLRGDCSTGMYTVHMFGAEIDVLVMSPKEYELSRHMKEPHVIDTSDLVLSPMPGTLISYAVQEGDHVEIGQELCIVEAMKMQNVIRSERAGVVGKCLGVVGASLRADEIIIEFLKTIEEEEKGVQVSS